MNKLPILFLLLTIGLPLAAEDSPGKAVIVTDVAKPVSCIAPVAITQIDGRLVQVSPQRFEIDEGEHTMTGVATLDLRYCPSGGTAAERMLDRRDYPPLEGYFEAGKQYFVGFDHSASDASNWGLAVWKVELAHGHEKKD